MADTETQTPQEEQQDAPTAQAEQDQPEQTAQTEQDQPEQIAAPDQEQAATPETPPEQDQPAEQPEAEQPEAEAKQPETEAEQPEAEAEQPEQPEAEQPEKPEAEAEQLAQPEELPAPPTETPQAPSPAMPVQQGLHRVRIEDLLKAGTHFGHLTSRWNPKMKPYIFMERNGIHIIDLMRTQELLDKAADAASRFAKQGRKILFVGTKKQAKDTVRAQAQDSDSPYVVERWLGGTLTNFQTIRKSIRRMEDLAKMEKDGTLDQLKKKERLMKKREREKLERNLSGIAEMARMPGALFIVDINREHIAVAEARKLGIPIIAMVDCNCDPDLVEYVVPCNDDAHKSIQLITTAIASAISEGKKQREIDQASKKAEKQKREEGKASS